jgi:hypothetical protein
LRPHLNLTFPGLRPEAFSVVEKGQVQPVGAESRGATKAGAVHRRALLTSAPWRVVAAESKHYARVAVLKTVISSIEQALRAVGREPVGIDAAL